MCRRSSKNLWGLDQAEAEMGPSLKCAPPLVEHRRVLNDQSPLAMIFGRSKSLQKLEHHQDLMRTFWARDQHLLISSLQF